MLTTFVRCPSTHYDDARHAAHAHPPGTSSNQAFIETFSFLLQDELDRRRSRLIERRYQQSGLDEKLTLAEFDWGFNQKPRRNLHANRNHVNNTKCPVRLGAV